MRDRILTGRLRPGDRLDLDRAHRRVRHQPDPVREALLELSYEGLVVITPRSGIAVVGITPQDAVDNFADPGCAGRQGGRDGDRTHHA